MSKGPYTVEFAERRGSEHVSAPACTLSVPVRGWLTAHCQRGLQEVFDQADDVLFERASRSASNAGADLYFDAMRSVRRQKEPITRAFVGRLVDAYDRFWTTGPTVSGHDAQTPLTEEMALLDAGEVEEDLAASGMVAKACKRHQQALVALGRRMAYLAGRVELDVQANPLGPHSICTAFVEALRPVHVDIKAKLVVYKLFDHHVLDSLGRMYQRINDHYASAGVLPELVHAGALSTPLPAARGGGSSLRATAEGGGRGSCAADSAGVRTELFRNLQQLLQAGRGETEGMIGRGGDGAERGGEVDRLLNALSSLQRSDQPMTPVAGSGLKRLLFPQVGVEAANPAGSFSGTAEQDAIHIVTMLFEFILGDQNLPDAMRALLSRLQIPMLKVAILDKSFFSDPHHPARRLLNALARAGIGWTEDDGRGRDTLYGEIEAAVERVLGEFHTDVRLFAELLSSFEKYLAGERQSAALVEDRAAQAAEGKERLELAREHVRGQIESVLVGRDIPATVRGMLERGWRTVLVAIYLRDGADSTAWQEAWETLEALLASVQAEKTPAERAQLLEGIPSLLRRLREGLNAISYDAHQSNSFFKALQDIHYQCLSAIGAAPGAPPAAGVCPDDAKGRPGAPACAAKAVVAYRGTDTRVHRVGSDARATPAAVAPNHAGAGPTPPAVVWPEAPSGAHAEGAPGRQGAACPSAEPAGEGPCDLDDFARVAARVEVDTWVEFRSEHGRRLRAKLAWKSEATAALLFVNRRGMRVVETNVSGFAVELRRGSATVLDALPLIDRAMDAVLETLSRDLAPMSTTPSA